jgi:hypothetical protein
MRLTCLLNGTQRGCSCRSADAGTTPVTDSAAPESPDTNADAATDATTAGATAGATTVATDTAQFSGNIFLLRGGEGEGDDIAI